MATTPTQRVPVIGVGASAGGLEALRELFQADARTRTDMAFVVVQHLDPTHQSMMAELLEKYTSMRVTQVVGGERIEPDHIYIIPPAHGLAIHGGVLELTEFRDPRGLRRPIDDFFTSLAEDQGANAACVILSGTGGDGSRGQHADDEKKRGGIHFHGVGLIKWIAGLEKRVSIAISGSAFIRLARLFEVGAGPHTLEERRVCAFASEPICAGHFMDR